MPDVLPVTSDDATSPAASRSRLRRTGLGAVVGLISGGASLAVGEVSAVFVRPAASPILAVGNRLILLTPESVKRWAIRQFGTHDKQVLLTGIYLTLAVAAVVIGVVALRRLRVGLAGVAALGLLGMYSALTAHAHHTSDAIPSLLGAVGGMAALRLLTVQLASVDVADGPGHVTGRRVFLQSAGLTAVAAVIGSIGGKALQRKRFDASSARAAVVLPTPSGAAPAAPARFDLGKSGVPFLTPSSAFYRIDTALTVPQIDPAHWSLRIHGMVTNPITITYAQLLARPQVRRYVTLACVSNEVGGTLISTAEFQGVLLADLLREAGVHPGADQLVASSEDGMTIGSPTAVVMDGRDAMLAVGMNGEPLPAEHGFPVRMVVPGLYGYVSACKWIVDLEATTFADTMAYWVQGGWAAQGPVELASRIDTPHGGATVRAGSTVPVAGVAWDQHTGVSAVQVQVNNGEWQQATLAAVPSTDTWRQWVYLWDVPAAGSYRLSVRAVDAHGTPQIAAPADSFPSGATGYHSISVRAR